MYLLNRTGFPLSSRFCKLIRLLSYLIRTSKYFWPHQEERYLLLHLLMNENRQSDKYIPNSRDIADLTIAFNQFNIRSSTLAILLVWFSLCSSCNPSGRANSTRLGNLIGPQTFREDQAPAYTGGFISMLICYCVCILLMAIYWAIAFTLNRRTSGRADMEVSPGEEDSAELFTDQTDFQQKNFKYTT